MTQVQGTFSCTRTSLSLRFQKLQSITDESLQIFLQWHYQIPTTVRVNVYRTQDN